MNDLSITNQHLFSTLPYPFSTEENMTILWAGYQSLEQAEEGSEDKLPGEAPTSKLQTSIPHKKQPKMRMARLASFQANICAMCSGDWEK